MSLLEFFLIEVSAVIVTGVFFWGGVVLLDCVEEIKKTLREQ